MRKFPFSFLRRNTPGSCRSLYTEDTTMANPVLQHLIVCVESLGLSLFAIDSGWLVIAQLIHLQSS